MIRKVAQLLLVLIFSAIPVAAQFGDGVVGWCTPVGPGQEECFGDPLSACARQYQAYADPRDAFEGYYPYSTYARHCDWLYRGEGGHSLILPTVVLFRCANGYVREPPDRCVVYHQKEREACQGAGGGSPNPTGGTNPILLSTGTKYQTEVDYSTPANPFGITRYYRSREAGNPVEYQADPLGLGANWRLSFEYELHINNSFNALPYVTAQMPDGSAYDFQRMSNGTLQAIGTDAAQVPVRLSFLDTWPSDLNTLNNVPRHWQLTLPDNRVLTLVTFRIPNQTKYSIARPQSIVDSNGYQLNFVYDSIGALQSITDSFGQTYTFTWIVQDPATYGGTSGVRIPLAISRITLPDNTAIRYSYDTASPAILPFAFPDRLIKVEYLNTSGVSVGAKNYLYEDSRFTNALTGIVDERGIRIETWSYDSKGRAITSEGAAGNNRYTVSYVDTANNATRTVTNPLGKAAVYQFTRTSDIVRLQTVTGQPSANCIGTTRGYQYNPQGFLIKTTDARGNQTLYAYSDPLGRITSITEGATTPVQRVTTISWDPLRWLPASISTPLLRKSFTYNPAGQLTQLTEQDLATSSIRAWNYAYGTGGLLTSVDGPLAGVQDTIKYGYLANGYLNLVADQVENTIKISAHNGRGLPTTIFDQAGVQTNLTYDARGRLVKAITDVGGIGAQWLFNYDLAGNLTKITYPDGTFISYDYDDSRRISRLQRTDGDFVELLYNLLGNITHATVKNAAGTVLASHAQTFDELGRLLAQIGASNQTWSVVRDGEGNITSSTDPRSNSVTFQYDSLNRLSGATNEEQAHTTLVRTADGDISNVADARNVQTHYTRNAMGEIVAEQSNDAGTKSLIRNAAGNVTQKTDARGVVSNFAYDAAQRLTAITFPSAPTENVTFTYDGKLEGKFGKGRLTSSTDESGKSSYVYDAQGRVVKESRISSAGSFATQYTYDRVGRLTKMIYPSGRGIRFDRDVNGNVSNIFTTNPGSTNWNAVSTAITWRSFGPLTGLSHPNGVTEQRSYDQDYRLSSINLAHGATALFARNYSYGDGINITGIEDTLTPARSEDYNYSPTNRLTEAGGVWGELTTDYDASGNRLLQTVVSGGIPLTEQYSIATATNRLQNITGGSATRTFSYDAAGSETQDQSSTNKTYIYNAHGRLSRVLVDGNELAQYSYNASEQLVQRTSGKTKSIYVYDLHGHVLSETNEPAHTLREYVWLGDRPLAMFVTSAKGTVTTYYIHTDHLDRPVLLSGVAGSIVWRAEYKPWGEANIISNTVGLDLRLPGQWLQSETGLHYNWNRQYDPSTGRYIQSDPIGLQGGENRYSYAESNPINAIDPNGLDVWHLNQSYGGQGFGHAGTLVGNSSSGYDYYSKDGGPYDVHEHFNTLDEASNSSVVGNYDRSVYFETSAQQDDAMRRYADAHYQDPYDTTDNNCGDLARDIMTNGGIYIPRTPFVPTVPNTLYYRFQSYDVDQLLQRSGLGPTPYD